MSVINVAIAGNPNSGKTTIFNALTGSRHMVGNYPGITVEKKEGKIKIEGREVNFIDLPGTYSLTAYSLEELVARNFIVEEKPDMVVDIIDSSNLERSLYLAVQLMEMNVPLILAFNMTDLAELRGIEINVEELSGLLGIPIVKTIGNKKTGLDQLKRTIVMVAEGKIESTPSKIYYEDRVEEEIARLAEIIEKSSLSESGFSPQWLAVKLLEHDTEVEKRLSEDEKWEEIETALEGSRENLLKVLKEDSVNLIAEGRYGFIKGTMKKAVRHIREDHIIVSDKIDKVLLNNLLGIPIFVGVMYIVFQGVFKWAGPFMDLIDAFFGWMGSVAALIIPEGLIQSLVVDGIIGGVGGVLIFLPQILFLFFFIALLEGSGYMARAAFIMDRVMEKFGLNGKAFVPLLSSFACAIPGIMATRTIESEKGRLVTMLLAPLMSCSARLPVYTLMISALIPQKKIFGGLIDAQGFTLFSLYFGGILVAMVMALIFKATILKGESPPLVIELPPYRIPTLKEIFVQMWDRSKHYVQKAGTIILAISIVIWFLFTFPRNPDTKVDYDKLRENRKTEFVQETGFKPGALEEGGDLYDKYLPYAEFDKAVEEGGFEEGDEGYKSAKDTLDKELSVLKAESPDLFDAVSVYREKYLPDIEEIDNKEAMELFSLSYGGKVGRGIEPVFRPLGMDWRLSVAMVASFAAKEVFVAAMGTLYSLGGEVGAESKALIQSVRDDPLFAGRAGILLAIVVMVFSLLSTPCMATVAVVKQESGSWGWAGFLVLYTLVLAWIVCFTIWQGGRLVLEL
ncbi:MAG: ferrous iron transport protein B [Deltaproteobacteria bacterium]|uniref:Ferrous iron transport protein B n=1 Tax=Candidatus Zymogenus saltonus TaxID=2844893 RepID=A0A9D8KDX0_9DELT|nr:ferrous iron transport protein B [Candidatus Zymogenus saltonus]